MNNTPRSPSLPPKTPREDEGFNKEELMQKLQHMPIDKLKSIITNQLDLEIRLKHKELNLTDEEIGKCESQMISLRKFFKIPPNVNFDNEPNGFTHKYTNLLGKSLNVNYENISRLQSLSELNASASGSLSGASAPHSSSFSAGGVDSQHHSVGGKGVPPAEFYDPTLPTHSYRTRSTTSSLRPSMSSSRRVTYGCLYRRTDGVIVKLTCPVCSRSNFSSAQGFLNHSRIAHSKEYTSQDAAALQSGEVLPDEEQDEEGLQSLQSLKQKGLDANKHLNANEIYFNGLSTSLGSSQNSSQTQSQSHSQTQSHSSGYDQSLNGSQGLEHAYNAPVRRSTPPQAQAAMPVKRKNNDLLMKKLIERGITQNESEYDKLVHDTIKEVENPHLFNGEEDENDEAIEGEGEKAQTVETDTTEEVQEGAVSKNRRRSRGGYGISKPSIGSSGPILKIKLKRNDN